MTIRPPRSSDPPEPATAGAAEEAGAARRRSHREKKEEREALEVLTQRLVSLRPHELDRADLEPDLRSAIDELGRLSGSARGRQAKFVHGLLRRSDLDDLDRRLGRIGRSSYAPTPATEKTPLEVWLERLLTEGDAAVNELVDAHPGADRQQLRQLIRTSRKTPPTTASRRALRSLEAALAELLGSHN